MTWHFQVPLGATWQTQEYYLGLPVNEVLLDPKAVAVDLAVGPNGPILVIVGPYPGADAVKRTFLVSFGMHYVVGEQGFVGRFETRPPPGVDPYTWMQPGYVFERLALPV